MTCLTVFAQAVCISRFRGAQQSLPHIFSKPCSGGLILSSTVGHLHSTSIGFENGFTSDVYWFRNVRYRHLLEVHSTTTGFGEETFLLLVEPLPSTNASPSQSHMFTGRYSMAERRTAPEFLCSCAGRPRLPALRGRAGGIIFYGFPSGLRGMIFLPRRCPRRSSVGAGPV